MKTDKFNYDLPEHLIAQYPSPKRTDSKLLVAIESIQHNSFKDIGNHINKGDLLILNKTSVVPARLYGEKSTGGKIEVLLERFLSNNQTLTQIRSSRAPKEGSELVFSLEEKRFLATVKGRKENFFILDWSHDPKYLFEQYGQIPLPPYMNRAVEKLEAEVERQPKGDEIGNQLEMSGDEVLMAMQYSRRHSSLHSPFQDGENSSLLDIIEDDQAEEPEANIMRESMSEEVTGALETLSGRERSVLEMYFGINRDSAMTLNEIGEEFDLTRERVRQIKEKAIQRLRHRSRSKSLRRYLG